METTLLIVVMGLIFCICFLCGAIVGQKCAKGQDIKIENPVKAIKENIEENKSNKQREKEQEILDTIAQNIDNYDGTSRGQKEIPR